MKNSRLTLPSGLEFHERFIFQKNHDKNPEDLEFLKIFLLFFDLIDWNGCLGELITILEAFLDLGNFWGDFRSIFLAQDLESIRHYTISKGYSPLNTCLAK